jgi:membrane protease YdiL (CAAX protease family)
VLPVERQTNNQPSEPEAAPGIFDRLNNYLLLFYAGACLLMYYSLSGFLYLSGLTLLSLSLPGIVGILFPFYILSSRFSLRFADEYRIGAPSPETTFVALVITAGTILPVEALSTFMEKKWPPDADYINFLLSIKPKGMLSFAAVAFGIGIVTPAAEEFLFRGFIQRIFHRNMPAALAIVLSSVLFAAAHFDISALPAAALLGAVYGYLFYLTGNLFYSILGHVLFNFISLLRLNAIQEENLEIPEFRYPPPILVALSLVVLVLALMRLRRFHRPRRHG